MKHGDFTDLAKFYVDRPGYSITLLRYIAANIQNELKRDLVVADVGAGTGKLTENLEQIGMSGFAVEPNDAMRAEGKKLFLGRDTFEWRDGAAEMTGLPDDSVDWVLMGSSFHWADAPRAKKEFCRVLKPGGFFTAIWNPRDIQRSPLHMEIEEMIHKEIPDMKRVSSGGTVTTEVIHKKLCGAFRDIIFMECMHEETMSKERYINIWRSVNDIQVQAGKEGFQRILDNISNILKDYNEISVPYKSRAWTAQVCK
ncbi:class I SAM-dependent methyltransferase [bacterium D16-51]|nr:class I SAM-dependent methyltransferase [bacterium D16-59]RKI62316.1 class I SAM-dependent methyltransferase [bacterium D16-51]